MEKWESLRYVEHLDEFSYVHLEKEPDRDIIWSGLEGGREGGREGGGTGERERENEGERKADLKLRLGICKQGGRKSGL